MIPGKNRGSGQSRREREMEARRQAILESAKHIMMAEGYHNTTIAQIAAAAEFGIGTIYQFFPTKQKLLEDVMLWTLAEFIKGLEEAVSQKKIWQEQLSAFIRHYLYWTEQEPKLPQMIQDVVLSAPPDEATAMIEQLKNCYKEIIRILEDILHDIIKKSDTENAELITLGIIGTVQAISDAWTMNMLGKTPTAYSDRLVNRLIIILGGTPVE